MPKKRVIRPNQKKKKKKENQRKSDRPYNRASFAYYTNSQKKINLMKKKDDQSVNKDTARQFFLTNTFYTCRSIHIKN